MAFISQFKEAHKRLQRCLDVSLMAKNPMGIAFAKTAISGFYE